MHAFQTRLIVHSRQVWCAFFVEILESTSNQQFDDREKTLTRLACIDASKHLNAHFLPYHAGFRFLKCERTMNHYGSRKDKQTTDDTEGQRWVRGTWLVHERRLYNSTHQSDDGDLEAHEYTSVGRAT